MFGYVRPLRGELKVRTFEQYQAAYCGLCRTLGANFGFAARFTVSYDLVFLFLLLDGTLPQLDVGSCRCPAHPLHCKNCICEDAALQRAAAMNVILTYWKLDDSLHDESLPRRLAARCGKVLLGRAYRKASRGQEEMAQLVQRQLAGLAQLEQARCDSMDRYADAFAQILRGMGDLFGAPELARPARELLYHVGRYLYLTDALDDLERDLQKGRFNPLALRFTPVSGALTPADKQYLLESIECSLDQAAAALELLPLKCGDEILHNIIYLGLPAVLKSVADGTFHKQKKRNRSKL